MQPLSNETKSGREEAGATLRLRRAVPAQEGGGDMRTRLILALADTVDTDYAARGYPLLEQEKGGRAVSVDARLPVLRMRSGANVSVQEAVAALVSGTAPTAPTAPVVAVAPVGGPMMNQKSEVASGQPPAGSTASPVPGGEPLAVKRKLEVRSGAVPAWAGSAPAFVGSQSVATRAPLLPLPIDAALSGKSPVVAIPEPVSAQKKVDANVAGQRKKNASIGFGAVLVSVFLALFLVGIFWMQRGDKVADGRGGPGETGGETSVAAEVGSGQASALPEAVLEKTSAVQEAPAVAIGQLATVSGTVAWEMADAGWAGEHGLSESIPADVVVPVAERRAAGGQVKAPVKAVPGVAPEANAAVAAPVEGAAARRPAPSRAFQVFVENLKVSGVLQQTPVRAIIDGVTVFAGDVVEPTQGIRLVGADFERRQLIFEDKTRAQVKIFY